MDYTDAILLFSDGVGTEDILGMAFDSYPKCSMYELCTY